MTSSQGCLRTRAFLRVPLYVYKSTSIRAWTCTHTHVLAYMCGKYLCRSRCRRDLFLPACANLSISDAKTLHSPLEEEEEEQRSSSLYGLASSSLFESRSSSTSLLASPRIGLRGNSFPLLSGQRPPPPAPPPTRNRAFTREEEGEEPISSALASSVFLSSSLSSSRTAPTVSTCSSSSSGSSPSARSSSLDEGNTGQRRRGRRRRKRDVYHPQHHSSGKLRSHPDTEDSTIQTTIEHRQEARHRLSGHPDVSSSACFSLKTRRRRKKKDEEEGGTRRATKKSSTKTRSSPTKMIPSHSLFIPPLRLSSACFSSSSRLVDGSSSLTCRYTAATARSAVPRGRFAGGSSEEEDGDGASSARYAKRERRRIHKP